MSIFSRLFRATKSARIPTRRFDGHLKFHRPEFLNEIGAKALAYAFPGFSGVDQPTLQMRTKAEMMKSRGVDTVYFNLRPARRFAGDFTLPRGCYFSVCQNFSGNDGGTVARELLAYTDPETTGEVEVIDLSRADFELLAKQSPTPPPYTPDAGVMIIFRSRPERINPFLPILEQSGYINSESVRDPSFVYCVTIPFIVRRTQIERVIDLRYPEIQDWFFNLFREFKYPDQTSLMKIADNKVSSFLEMLPTLMFWDRGGNDATDAIGMWMRGHSIDALIFPSARSNAGVTIRNGSLTEFRGWNLVDYRNSEPLGASGKKQIMTDASPWETRVGKGVGIRSAASHPEFGGSWEVMGNEEWHQQLFRAKVEAFYARS